MKITDEEYQLEILKNLHRKFQQSPMFVGYFRLEIPEKAEADLNSFSYNIRYLEEKGFINTDSARAHAKITSSGIDYLKEYTEDKKKTSELSNFYRRLKKDGALRKERDLAQRLYDLVVTHDGVRAVSESHFKRDAYRISVLDALISLEEMVKEKAEYPKVRGKELSGTRLMRHVFDVNNPILTWNLLKTQTDKDELEGYQNIMAGAIQGIRNPHAHRIFQQRPMRALQLLVLATLLAELVDASQKHKRTTPNPARARGNTLG